MRRRILCPRVIVCLSAIILSMIILVVPTQACSSFAAYSNTALYGLNFDFPGDPELLFLMEQDEGEIRHFTLCFEASGTFVRMAGMNAAGLMASLQAVPYRAGTPRLGSSKGMDISALMTRALRTAETVDEVRKLVDSQRIIHVPGFDLHCLFADRHGKALIVEIGAKGNLVVTNTGNSIVMTNFYNSDFGPGDPVIAPGGVRYDVITLGLQEYMGNLTPQAGFDLLQSAFQPTTQASLVFLPAEQRVYFTIRRDMSRVWQVNLADGTIATESGFAVAKSVKLEQIPGSELLEWK